MCIKKMFKLAVAVFILVVARSRGSDESDGEDIDRVRDEKVPGEADDKNNLDTEHLYRPHTVNSHLCQSQPCKNGGECTDNFHSHLGYVCRCLPGYVGYLCEHEDVGCDVKPCENGGSCLKTSSGSFCKCPAEFIDPLCTTPNRRTIRRLIPRRTDQHVLIIIASVLAITLTLICVVYCLAYVHSNSSAKGKDGGEKAKDKLGVGWHLVNLPGNAINSCLTYIIAQLCPRPDKKLGVKHKLMTSPADDAASVTSRVSTYERWQRDTSTPPPTDFKGEEEEEEESDVSSDVTDEELAGLGPTPTESSPCPSANRYPCPPSQSCSTSTKRTGSECICPPMPAAGISSRPGAHENTPNTGNVPRNGRLQAKPDDSPVKPRMYEQMPELMTSPAVRECRNKGKVTIADHATRTASFTSDVMHQDPDKIDRLKRIPTPFPKKQHSDV